MAGSDIVFCQFNYFNQPTDQFYCTDRFADSTSMPIVDQENDVTNIATTTTYDPVMKQAVYFITFDKRMQSDMIANEDYNLENGATVNGIWAQGKIIGGVA